MFFKFLSFYAPTSTNIASFDEFIVNISKELGVEEIKIDNGIYENVVKEFFCEKNIILSGTAGDGKTYILRKLFFEWGEEKEFYNFTPIIHTQNFKIYFIKDFTELSIKDKKFYLQKLEKSIFENSKERLIIAANDGILIDSLKKFKMNRLLKLIENLIDGGEHKRVALFDLFQTSSAKNFSLLLDEIIKRAKETPCEYKDCVIHNNIKLLENKEIKEQLIKLIKISDLNYEHLTFRKLYMIIANMILGYEKGVFTSCKEANEYYKNKDKIKSAFYNNIFGDNLLKSDKEKIEGFLELNIGKESSNIIDEKLLYEEIEVENYFFNKEKFEKIKEKFFEDNSNYEELNQYLIYLRRYLFFANKSLSKELIIYKYLDEFIEIIQNQKQDKKIIQKLIKALNRIFLGELVDEDSELFLASSFTNSFSKISDEIIDKISIREIKFEFITSKIDNNFVKVYLIVDNVKLEMDLHMYEFLRRVSEGILPLSFSTEYYEKVLNFKSKLLSNKEYNDFELFDVENFRVHRNYLSVEDL